MSDWPDTATIKNPAFLKEFTDIIEPYMTKLETLSKEITAITWKVKAMEATEDIEESEYADVHNVLQHLIKVDMQYTDLENRASYSGAEEEGAGESFVAHERKVVQQLMSRVMEMGLELRRPEWRKALGMYVNPRVDKTDISFSGGPPDVLGCGRVLGRGRDPLCMTTY